MAALVVALMAALRAALMAALMAASPFLSLLQRFYWFWVLLEWLLAVEDPKSIKTPKS